MKLIYGHNLVRQGIATIFVNTECDSLKYENAAEKGTQAAKLFTEVLNFNKVFTYTDLSHREIIEEMHHLKQISVKAD